MNRLLEKPAAEQCRLAAVPNELNTVMQRILQHLPGHGHHDAEGHDLVATYSPIIAVGTAQIAQSSCLNDKRNMHPSLLPRRFSLSHPVQRGDLFRRKIRWIKN